MGHPFNTVSVRERNYSYVKKYRAKLANERMALWEKQGKCCAICRESIPVRGRHASCIDKDPATREIRGMLCPRCQDGIKGFQDSQTILAAATEYLRRFELERKRRRRSIKPV